MKCVEITDKKMRKSDTPRIIRVSDEKAEQLVDEGKAEYRAKRFWKLAGRERG